MIVARREVGVGEGVRGVWGVYFDTNPALLERLCGLMEGYFPSPAVGVFRRTILYPLRIAQALASRKEFVEIKGTLHRAREAGEERASSPQRHPCVGVYRREGTRWYVWFAAEEWVRMHASKLEELKEGLEGVRRALVIEELEARLRHEPPRLPLSLTQLMDLAEFCTVLNVAIEAMLGRMMVLSLENDTGDPWKLRTGLQEDVTGLWRLFVRSLRELRAGGEGVVCLDGKEHRKSTVKESIRRTLERGGVKRSLIGRVI